jgi:hypothetical protein
MRCANGRKDGKAIAVCGWADHGSMAVALFVGRTIEQSAPILKDLREAIIERG